jgi:peptide/nickel transport system permease protein
MASLREFVLTRLLTAIPTIFILLTVIFFLTHIIPGDPARALVGENAPEEYVDKIREAMGLDKPIIAQYFDYLGGILRGDLGKSIYSFQIKTVNVASLISDRIPTTIQLTVIAWTFSTILGVVSGIFSSIYEGGYVDNFFRIVFLLLYSLPLFVLGIFSQLIFGVYLGVFPIFGLFSESHRIEPITGYLLIDNLIIGNFAGFIDVLSHLILPSLTLAAYYSGLMSRLSRAEMVKALSRMYCLVAEAKGLRRRTIAFKHALRNAALPIVTLSGLQTISLLTGSILVETIFSLNGLASLFISAALQRDYLVIQGCVTVFALISVFIGIIVDIAYFIIDPRIRY